MVVNKKFIVNVFVHNEPCILSRFNWLAKIRGGVAGDTQVRKKGGGISICAKILRGNFDHKECGGYLKMAGGSYKNCEGGKIEGLVMLV